MALNLPSLPLCFFSIYLLMKDISTCSLRSCFFMPVFDFLDVFTLYFVVLYKLGQCSQTTSLFSLALSVKQGQSSLLHRVAAVKCHISCEGFALVFNNKERYTFLFSALSLTPFRSWLHGVWRTKIFVIWPPFSAHVCFFFWGRCIEIQVSEAATIRSTNSQMNRQEEWRQIKLPRLKLL